MPRTNAAAAPAPAAEEPKKPAVEATTAAIPARYRKNVTPVRSRRNDINAEEYVGKARTRHMKSTGPARQALEEPPLVEAVEHVTKEKLEALRFNEDILTVVVHDSTNETDEPFPEVFNDGIVQRFERGKEMQVKRKYVEVLARSKKVTRGNQKYKDGEGNDAYRYPAHSALRYPFSVIHDPSPKGPAWLKGILSQEA